MDVIEIKTAENGYVIQHRCKLFILRDLGEVHNYIEEQWGKHIGISMEDMARKFSKEG